MTVTASNRALEHCGSPLRAPMHRHGSPCVESWYTHTNIVIASLMYVYSASRNNTPVDYPAPQQQQLFVTMDTHTMTMAMAMTMTTAMAMKPLVQPRALKDTMSKIIRFILGI